MVTTSRMIVVLRADLGRQLALANKKLVEAQNVLSVNVFDKYVKNAEQIQKSIWRLEDAIHALGRLNLGDIVEDEEYEGKF